MAKNKRTLMESLDIEGDKLLQELFGDKTSDSGYSEPSDGLSSIMSKDDWNTQQLGGMSEQEIMDIVMGVTPLGLSTAPKKAVGFFRALSQLPANLRRSKKVVTDLMKEMGLIKAPKKSSGSSLDDLVERYKNRPPFEGAGKKVPGISRDELFSLGKETSLKVPRNMPPGLTRAEETENIIKGLNARMQKIVDPDAVMDLVPYGKGPIPNLPQGPIGKGPISKILEGPVSKGPRSGIGKKLDKISEFLETGPNLTPGVGKQSSGFQKGYWPVYKEDMAESLAGRFTNTLASSWNKLKRSEMDKIARMTNKQFWKFINNDKEGQKLYNRIWKRGKK